MHFWDSIYMQMCYLASQLSLKMAKPWFENVPKSFNVYRRLYVFELCRPVV
jgi:hypothetical protein